MKPKSPMLTRIRPKRDLPPVDVAIRPMLADETTAILRAILDASDYGVLLTDLNHQSLACNRRFGEQFAVDPERVVRYGVEELREKVLPLIEDPQTWLERLEVIYADPEMVYEDDLTLRKATPIVLHRYTGPVRNADGSLIGRLWTFRDITREKRIQRMADCLHEVSAFHHPEPATVYRRVLDVVANYYHGTTALLSVLQQDCMEFRALSGPDSLLKQVKSNPLADSYCQFAVSAMKPVLIQNSRQEEAYRKMKPSRVGLTRYLGVPIRSSKGEAIGTLCLLDGLSEQILSEDDAAFLSMMAMRIGAELDREEYIRERIAEHQAVVERQQRELAVTHQVLAAMNQAFGLVTGGLSREQVLREQTKLLKGLLGYDGAAILMCDGHTGRGFHLACGSDKPKPLSVGMDEDPDLAREMDKCDRHTPRMRFFQSAGKAAKALGCSHVGVACLWQGDAPIAALLLGKTEAPPLHDSHHLTHLEALVDQVCLVLTSHLLHAQLVQAHEELHDAQQQLVQGEKLSVVGTLAAGTAHDIRNILSSLSLEIEASSDEPERALEAVREQLGRFSVLAHRLLSYAKPRKIATQQVELDAVLQKVIALTSAQLRIMDIELTYSAGKDMPPLQADAHQLEHLFVNLILNGVQAMDKGGRLQITTKRDGQRAVITVSDTGKGIAKDVAEKLFQPFSSTRTEGFGLGLYSCKRIVEEHGGQIGVERNVPAGTTFTISLPAGTGRGA
jgi:signal transduction histidine kinase/GAF domain-containing protein